MHGKLKAKVAKLHPLNLVINENILPSIHVKCYTLELRIPGFELLHVSWIEGGKAHLEACF